jgi:hypothetical protein
MFFSKPIEEIMLKRKSIRTYRDIAIPENEKSRIRDFISQGTQTPFNSEIRFEMIETGELDRDQIRSLGTYGMISGTKYFIAGTVKRDAAVNNKISIAKEKFIDYGFALEKIVLFLTDMDLGTCWLGGSFNKAGFTKKINASGNEIIPAVTPFGFESEKRTLLDRMVRGVAGSKYRKKWNELFFKNDFTTPLPSIETGIYSKPLEMLRIAPSASNKQPWRIIGDKDKKIFHMFLQRTRNYPKPFGTDIQMVDIGIAMCHFELTCRESGIEGLWKKLGPAEIPTPINTSNPGEDISYIASWSY